MSLEDIMEFVFKESHRIEELINNEADQYIKEYLKGQGNTYILVWSLLSSIEEGEYLNDLYRT